MSYFTFTVQGGVLQGDQKDERFWGLAFCSLYVIKGYVLPSRPLFFLKKSKLCKTIILFTSRCMYKEWREKNGNVREMSNACWLCPLYFTSWNVLSREVGPGQGHCGGPRSHLLVTLNKTSAKVWIGWVGNWWMSESRVEEWIHKLLTDEWTEKYCRAENELIDW